MTLYGKEGTTQIVELEGGGCVISFLSNNEDGTAFVSLKGEPSGDAYEDQSETAAYFTGEELLDLAEAALELYEQSISQTHNGVLSTYGLGRASLDYRQKLRPATK